MVVEQQPAYESFGQFRARISRELSFAQRELLALTNNITESQPTEGISVERKFVEPNNLTSCANQIRISFFPDAFQIEALPTSVKEVLPDIVEENRDLEVVLALDDPDSIDFDDKFFSFAIILKSRIPRPDTVSLGVSSLEVRRPFVVTAETVSLSDEQRRIMEKYERLGLMVHGEIQFRAILAEGSRWAEKIIRGRVYPQILNIENRERRVLPTDANEARGHLLNFKATA